MGNKIGDYIHWKYDNYLQYSIQYPDESRKAHSPNLTQVFQDQRNTILSEIASNRNNKNKKDIQNSLENKLNYFFNAKTLGTENVVNEQGLSPALVQQMFIEAFNKKYHKKAIKLDDNLSANIGEGIGEVSSYFKPLVEGERNQELAIGNRLKQIESAYTRMSLRGDSSDGIDDILSQIDNFTSDFSDIIQEVLQFMENLKEDLEAAQAENVYIKVVNDKLISIKKINKQVKDNVLKINGAGKMMIGRARQDKFIKALNQIYESLKKASAAYYTGIAGEVYAIYMATIVPKVASGITKRELSELLNILFNGTKEQKAFYGLIGTQKSPGILKMDLFADTHDIGKNSKLTRTDEKIPDYVYHLSNQKMELHSTQDKVDAIFTLENDEKINASIKNYDLSLQPKFGLLSGTSILKYVQQYTIFLNHYLNITASHSDKGKQPPNETIKFFNQLMYLTITLKALAGGVYKLQNNQVVQSQQAELFVVNDNSIGRYRVYFIDDIINFLEKNFRLIDKWITIQGFPINNVWHQEFEGVFAKTITYKGYGGKAKKKGINRGLAHLRILKLLNVLDQFKLEVSMSSNILGKIS